jgi:predicted secreted protein
MLRPRLPAWLAVMCLCLAVTARADTMLHLGETATVMAAPDEIAASLRAEATSASASDAQSRVNATIKEALVQAGKTAGVVTSTGSYSVWRTGPTPTDKTERWQVSQTLNLTGHDGPVLLTLVGTLQQNGLVISNLGWRLSRDAQRKAHQDATRQVLSMLRGRVEDAASQLNMRFDQFKDIRLDSAGPAPMLPRLAVPMAMSVAAAAAPLPSAQAEDVPVTASAEADAILLPR